ncbi:MAG: Gfo/Idh/MocA family oxidoreductase [Nitrospirales bacterium]|nr:Gfo/Idh/MocA family oxidoreductase [Nitrospira sp.]MDR4502086.1 Gfo/Idh/MocA family oxidoreductase [Nitrospirales bacterium]
MSAIKAAMRSIVVGLGVQGHKRRQFAKDDFVVAVDPVNSEAEYRTVEEVPLSLYDAALVCIPDEPKIDVLSYLIRNQKHVLVEKPLWAKDDVFIQELDCLAKRNGVVCYTAYNHRFEPHFVRLRNIIDSGVLGPLFHCRMFYGNGTARLVKESRWRDQGAGVLPDLGSHLLDTIKFWFGDPGGTFYVQSVNCFENQAPDHVIVRSNNTIPQIELEMTLLSWRNHFTCDLFAEKGSAHIRSLCKWGPTTCTVRTRVLPSGRPPEESVTLTQDDPTWELEYEYFKSLCHKKKPTDLSTDIWLNHMLGKLGSEALEKLGIP